MDFKDYLVQQGVSEEQATAVVSGMPEKNFYLTSEEKLDERYEKLKQQKTQLEEQLQTNQSELDNLKQAAEGNEELSKQLQELQAKFDESEQSAKQQLAEQEKSFAVKLALKEANALDEDIVLSLLNQETIQIVEGKPQGMQEQLKSLQENKPFLFQQEKTEEDPKPKIVFGGNPQQNENNDDPFAEKLAKYN